MISSLTLQFPRMRTSLLSFLDFIDVSHFPNLLRDSVGCSWDDFVFGQNFWSTKIILLFSKKTEWLCVQLLYEYCQIKSYSIMSWKTSF
jgi:hypothetical protein